MRFLNPRTDFAFKKIFGSEKSQDILLSFLNAILNLQAPYRIDTVQIMDPYQAPVIQGIKDTYVDVKARDEQGRWYIIEMQVLNVEGFEKRVLYNACKTYVGQLDTAESYGLLTDVIAITITNFLMFKEHDNVVNTFKLRADDGGLYGEDLQLVFAELPKFQKKETELVSVLDKWFYFLKYAQSLHSNLEVLSKEPAISHALSMANRAGLSREELEAQEKREMFIQDQRGALSKALADGEAKGIERGIKKGIEKGKAQGRAIGEKEATLRIAHSMLGTFDDNVIAGLTGLTVDTVKLLRNDTVH